MSQGGEAPAQEADGPDFVLESGASSSGTAVGSGGGSGSGNVETALGIRMHVTLNPAAAADFEYLVGAMPGKSPSDILSHALNELRKRRELGAGKSQSARPSDDGTKRTPKFSLASRYIPAALRRDVARRDGHRCTYVALVESRSHGVEMTGAEIPGAVMTGAETAKFEINGARRCEAIHQLEFDHVNPRAFGGQNTLANLRLLCRAHNNLAAKDLMGKEFIESRYGHG